MFAKVKYLAFLFITVLILALGACGSGEPITLADLEGIGFKGEETKDSTNPFPHIIVGTPEYTFNILKAQNERRGSKAWVGEITINGAPEFLEVVIFTSVLDDITKERWNGIAMDFGMRSYIINNIAISCQTQETCDYVKDKLR